MITRLISITILFSIFSTAQAAPNIWSESFGQGFNIFAINDVKGQKLNISCNSGAGDNFDHSATFETKNKVYENTDKNQPLSFIIDGIALAPSSNTNTRNGSNSWRDFTNGLSKAKKIDVYINNKKVTSLTPLKSSMKITKEIPSSCMSMFYQ